MRRAVVVIFLSLILLMGFSGSAVAKSERACVGEFISELAPALQRDFGQVIQQEAKDFQPFGRNIVSVFATTCELPE
jgi:hypothetical protein